MAQKVYGDVKSSARNNNRSVPEVVQSVITRNQVFHTSLKPVHRELSALAKVIKSEVYIVAQS